MCKFFSCITKGDGVLIYMDAVKRKKTKGRYDNMDSHTAIADYHGFRGIKEDVVNKYEYNPLTKILKVDQINAEVDDRELVQNELDSWTAKDWKKIVPELIVKPIAHPFLIEPKEVTKKDIADLKKWDSVRDSVWDSVRDSVWDSVRDSVWDSVRNSVWNFVGDSVGDSVGASVRDSVGASVRDSVGASVWASVRDSVGAYHSSFFDIEYKHDFSPCVRLWERGFVPSFDGKVWRLHSGKNAKIVYEINKEDLR